MRTPVDLDSLPDYTRNEYLKACAEAAEKAYAHYNHPTLSNGNTPRVTANNAISDGLSNEEAIAKFKAMKNQAKADEAAARIRGTHYDYVLSYLMRGEVVPEEVWICLGCEEVYTGFSEFYPDCNFCGFERMTREREAEEVSE